MPKRASFLALLALCGPVAGAELLSFEFHRDGRRVKVHTESFIDIPPAGVFAVLSDYDQLHRLSSLVTESRELAPDEHGHRQVYTLSSGCVAFFCRSVERIERVAEEPFGTITTVVIPEKSDVPYGESHWHLTPDGRGTRLVYDTDTELGFWVPPVIGNLLVSRWLRLGTENAIARIEYYGWHALYGDQPSAAHGGDEVKTDAGAPAGQEPCEDAGAKPDQEVESHCAQDRDMTPSTPVPAPQDH